MQLQEILQVKGKFVYTISPKATLGEVVDQLVEHRCGSLLVTEGDQLAGIITERDILRACAGRKASLDELTVAQYMTKNLVTGEPGDSVEKIMGLMTENRIRHLPVLEDGKLAGMISIGDVVKAQHDQLSVENRYLKEYIQS